MVTLTEQLQSVDTHQDTKEVGALGEGVWIGIMGPKRTGKGLLATNMALQAALKGVSVYHFGNLTFGTQIDDALVLLEQDPQAMRNSLIVFDEAKAHAMSSRQASTVMLLFENMMTQSGHFNISVIWTTTSQAGLHRVFKEQTHWMYWIDYQGVSKAEIFDDRPKGMALDDGWRLGLTNKCEGFAEPGIDDHMPQFRHREAHQGPPGLIDCREALVNLGAKMTFGKHNIRYLMVSQEASPFGPGGRREKGHFRCAHRFYALNKTDAYISALAMATTGAKDVKDAASHSEYDVIVQAVREFVVTPDKDGLLPQMCFPGPLRDFIRKTQGVEIPVNRVGVVMHGQLGVERMKKTSRGKWDLKSGYNIKKWVDQHPAE